MIAKKARKMALLLASVASVALFVPQTAGAVQPRFDPNLTQVFSDVAPGNPGCETYPSAGCQTVYPNSIPFGVGYEPGQAYVRGRIEGFERKDNAPAGPGPEDRTLAFVEVTITDGTRSVRTVTTARTTDQQATLGSPRGLEGYFNAELRVTELGSHSIDDNGGVSTLNVTLRAWTCYPNGGAPAGFSASACAANGTGASQNASLPNGTYSNPITLTKKATTGDDTRKPFLSKQTWAPEHWCHTSSKGATAPFFGHLGGEHNGRCGSLTANPSGPFPGAAIPDATWLACIRETSQPQKFASDVWTGGNGMGENAPAPVPSELEPAWDGLRTLCEPFTGQCMKNQNNPFRSNYCRASESASVPSGHAVISGHADDSTTSGGVSEIADITIEVVQGADSAGNGGTVVTRTNGTPAVYKNINRYGPRADWSFNLPINDFNPNWPSAPMSYRVKVTVTDAANNVQTTVSPAFTIYPY